MIKKFEILFVLMALPSMLGLAQDPDLKEVFLEAESYFLFEEYNEALPLYLRIHRADRSNDNINYKIGICFLNDPYQKEKSIRYLEQASKNVNPKYKENNYKETAAPLEVFYYLGDAYLINNQLQKALETYKHFRDILDPDIYDVELVDAQINTCERAMDLRNKEVDFDLINLGERINGRFADINPVLSGDGKSLVYVSKRQFYDASFYSRKIDGEWQAPRNIIPELGVDGDVYPTALSNDGKTMIIYRNDDFVGNLYVSYLVNGQWSNMQKLGENINTKYWESHGSLSKDGETLYFTSNRKGGYGGLDIYKSVKQADGTWGEPVNLGGTINTRYNEETPFISLEGDLLYFSSYGHFNIGGYDIFYSRQEDGIWGTPLNLGYPINTTDDDLFFLPLNNGNSGIISKYVTGGYGRHDLYYTEIYSENNPRMYMITGSFDTEKSLITRDDEMKIILIDSRTGDTLMVSDPDFELQSFEMLAPKGDFNVIINSKTYKQFSSNIEINDLTSKDGIDLTDQLFLEQKPYVPKIFAGEDSRIGIDNDTIEGLISGEEYEINLDLRRNARLYVDIYYDTILVKSDTLDISRRRFSYRYVPGGNKTMLDFTLEERNGDLSRSRVIVIPEEPVIEEPEPLEQVPDPDSVAVELAEKTDSTMTLPQPGRRSEYIPTKAEISDDYKAVSEIISDYSQYADEALTEVLKRIDPVGDDIRSRVELRSYLVNQMGIDQFELDAIEIYTTFDNDPALLLSYMIEHSEGEMKAYLEKLDLRQKGIESAEELVLHLRQVAGNQGFDPKDVVDVVVLMTQGSQSAERARQNLISVAEGEIKNYLRRVDLDRENIQSVEELIEHLREVSGVASFTTEEVEDLILKENLAGVPANEIIDEYIAIAEGDLKNYLMNLDPSAHGIETAIDLLNHLKEIAGKGSFSIDEINTLLSTDILVELTAEETRDYLRSIGSEGLVSYLEKLDLEEEGLYSSAELIDHLRKSAGKEPFSRLEIENLAADQLINNLTSNDLRDYLMESGDKELVEFLEGLDIDMQGLETAVELSLFLRKAATEELFDSDEINHLSMALKFRDLSAEQLRSSFAHIAEGDLKEYLLEIDLEKLGLSSGIDLVKHLIEVSGEESFSDDEISDLLTNVMVKDMSVDEAKDLLISSSSGELKEYLQNLNPKEQKITDAISLMNHLREVSEKNGFNAQEVNKVATMAHISQMDAADAIERLIMISDDDLKTFLENLDLEEKGIESGAELIEYLIEISEKQSFSVEDVNDLISTIHRQEVSAEDARLRLLEAADGKLQLLLQNLNFEKHEINSKRDLIAYLSEQVGKSITAEDLVSALPAIFNKTRTPSLFLDFLSENSPARYSSFFENLNLEEAGIDRIEELFKYLIQHADEIGMSEDEIMEFLIKQSQDFLTNPISTISSQFLEKEKCNIWQIILAVIGTGVLFFIIIAIRRKERQE